MVQLTLTEACLSLEQVLHCLFSSEIMATTTNTSPYWYTIEVQKVEVLRLQNTLQPNGHLGALEPAIPQLPHDTEWVCAHSTFRLQITAVDSEQRADLLRLARVDRQLATDKVAKTLRCKEKELQFSLQSDRDSQVKNLQHNGGF